MLQALLLVLGVLGVGALLADDDDQKPDGKKKPATAKGETPAEPKPESKKPAKP